MSTAATHLRSASARPIQPLPTPPAFLSSDCKAATANRPTLPLSSRLPPAPPHRTPSPSYPSFLARSQNARVYLGLAACVKQCEHSPLLPIHEKKKQKQTYTTHSLSPSLPSLERRKPKETKLRGWYLTNPAVTVTRPSHDGHKGVRLMRWRRRRRLPRLRKTRVHCLLSMIQCTVRDSSYYNTRLPNHHYYSRSNKTTATTLNTSNLVLLGFSSLFFNRHSHVLA